MKNTVYSASVTCVLLIAAVTHVNSQRCNGGVDCVLLSECTGLYSQLQRGATTQLTTLLRTLHCGFLGEDPKICCPPQFKTPLQGSPSGPGNSEDYSTNPTNTNRNHYPGSSGFEDNRYEYTNVNTNNRRQNPSRQNGGGIVNRGGNRQNLLPSPTVCGIQNNDRIVGGTQTDIDEHPWMALLRYDKPYGWGFYCGGVLISSRYVMTAAHCVKGEDLPSTWKLSQVRLGEWNTSSVNDCVGDDCTGPVLDVPVEQLIAHEQYNPSDSNQHNDIALLRLARDVQFTDFIKPICLPTTNELKRSSFDDYTMEVAGWGKTESRSESDVKLKVRVPVVSRSECARVFSRVSRDVIDRQLCAGGQPGQDSCRGDSGGALMGRAPTAENWLAIGVVSYGPSPCGTPGWPGVYTRVGAYVDWIISKMRP